MKNLLLPLLIFSCNVLFSQSQIGDDMNGEYAQDHFGAAISLSNSGDRLAVGARLNDDNGDKSGHVKIFERNDDTWTQLGSTIVGEAAFDQSGSALALSGNGNRIAIGAIQNTANGPASGHVRVFEYIGADWQQLGVDINGDEQTLFGSSVSLSGYGGNLAVGATAAQPNGVNSGLVRVFEFTGENWYQMGTDIEGVAEGDLCGFSVSIASNGQRVAVGARLNDGSATDAGHVRVFDFIDGDWVQIGSDINGEAEGDHSGTSISLSGNGERLAIGARLNQGNGNSAGHVRIFEYIEGSWIQMGEDIDGEAPGDISGTSVSLSHDGTRLAIGASSNDGNGNNSGQVRVYQYNWGSWMQVGVDIDGESAQDQSGQSVCLSYYGDELAIGAGSNDGNGTNSGHVRVFETGMYTALPENDFEDQITVQSDPVSGAVNIWMDEIHSDVSLVIRDITGAVISQAGFGTTDRLQFDLQHSAGIYLAEVRTGTQNRVVLKLLKY